MRITPLFSLLALGMFSLGAHAADDSGAPPPPNEVPFEAVDQNGDGIITREEAEGSPLGGTFDQADANGNGEVDGAEYAAFQLQQAGEGSPDPTEVPEPSGLTGS